MISTLEMVMTPPARTAETDDRRTRQDALPEHFEYRDEGCDLFSSCLGCPLPRCRYDEPGGARTMMNRVRDEEIRRLRYDVGVPVDEISVRFRVSRRTVFRVLKAGGPTSTPCEERGR
ncbi:MAG TPA: helix-turn-helix domain-containing protein [Dehalococcoidia bacterium]|nr:helix-turn-helix domain-containing protein [Dehalococcoidia bacterium]